MPRVLVVDDHDDARELLALIIGSRGYSVVTAASGPEALEEARRARPDVVIMDLFMPGMDGFETSNSLKADPELSPIPIVAYTARPNLPDLETTPFVAFLVKPCAPETLLATLEQVLGGSTGQPLA